MSNYCPNCGRPLQENEACYCSGNQTQQTQQAQQTQNTSTQSNTPPAQNNATMPYNGFAIAGFVVSIISLFVSLWIVMPIAGLTLSIIGFTQVRASNERGYGLAIAGIVLGACSLLYAIYVIVVVSSAINTLTNGLYY